MTTLDHQAGNITAIYKHAHQRTTVSVSPSKIKGRSPRTSDKMTKCSFSALASDGFCPTTRSMKFRRIIPKQTDIAANAISATQIYRVAVNNAMDTA